MFRRLRRLTGIERAEWPLVLSLGLIHFGIIAGFTLAKTARDALFLSMLPVRLLPWFYVVLALLAAVAAALLGKLTRRLLPRTTLAWVLGVSGAVFLLVALLAPLSHRVAAIGFYLWTGVYGLILVSQFWSVATDQVSPRRARHVLGLVGAGGILGGMAGGALAVAIGPHRPVEWLLWTGAGLHLALILPALRLDRLPHAEGRAEPTGGYVGYRRLVRMPYVRTMAFLFLAAGMASGLLDYQFKYFLQDHFSMNGGSIGVFMGKFYGAQSLAGLFLQFGLTGFLLSRLGARGASILLPAVFIAAASTLTLLPLFSLLVGLRLFDATMRVSVSSTAWEFLYFPLSDEVRQSARRFIEAVVNRGAEAVAGVLILLLGLLAPHHPIALSWLVLTPAALWFGGELMMNRFYVRELSRSLRRMSLNDDMHAAPMNDSLLVAELEEMTKNPEPTRALYAVDLLRRADPAGMERWLPPLLHHPAAAVRVRALETALDAPEALDLVEVEELTHHPDDDVRIHAQVFLYRLIPGGAVDNMRDLLEAADPRIRAVALETLADHAPEEEEEHLFAVAEALRGRTVTDRIAVAVAAGRRPPPSRLHALLPPLLVDAVPDVRRAAFAAVGQARLVDHVPFLVENLADRMHRGDAFDALVAMGPAAIDALGNTLLEPEVPSVLRRELPRALGLIGGDAAAGTLLLVLLEEDRALAHEALRALNRMRMRNPRLQLPRGEIARQIHAVGAEYLEILMYRSRGGAAGRPRRAAAARPGVARIARPGAGRPVPPAGPALSAARDLRGLPRRHGGTGAPALPGAGILGLRALPARQDDRDAADRRDDHDSAGARRRRGVRAPRGERGGDAARARRPPRSMAPELRALRDRGGRRAGLRGPGQSRPARRGQDRGGNRRADAPAPPGSWGGLMEHRQLSVVERALFLMDHGLLPGVSSSDLARLAANMTELEWETGHTERLDTQSLYVVTEGRIEMHMNGTPVGPMTTGQGFGLMALIGEDTGDDLSGVATTHTHVLAISREMFFEVLHEYPDVAIAMLQEVARSLMKLLREVEQLRRKAAGAAESSRPEN